MTEGVGSMKKSLASRIIGLAAIYCLVFIILVILQFSGKGNFSLSAGAMTIRGRYEELTGDEEIDAQRVTGGIRVFFGGLEFSLKEERDKGLLIADNSGGLSAINPEFMSVFDKTASFFLPGGSSIEFALFDSARGPELHITARLAENITEVTIPIIVRRSALVRDSGQLGLMSGGSFYSFANSNEELESGKLVLSGERSSVSYRSKSLQKGFDPDDYIIAQAQNYDSVVDNWLNSSYAYWNQNAASLQNEDDVIAYLSEALRRNNYTTAVAAVSMNFLNSPRQSYRSSVYIGGMSAANRSFTAFENAESSRITGLARAESLDLFKEEHLLDFLFSRNNSALAADVINIMQRVETEMIITDYCSGILEAYSDFKRYRPAESNPFEALLEQALTIVSENLNYDSDNDLLFASNSEGVSHEYSMRLGTALLNIAESDSPWAAIGRSLVLSALSSGNGNGKMYNMLFQTSYSPRLASLSGSLWAWTASSSVSSSYIDGNLNVNFSFPISSSHFVILKGISPFIKIQIHDMDWRTDSQFERYDSSGWIYYPQEQILILKLRHRTQLENVKIFYRVEAAPPAPVSVPSDEETLGDEFDYYY